MTFSANEIMQLAVQIEKNGVRLYSEASKLTEDSDSRRLFMQLAREEEQHIRDFKEIAEQLGVDPSPYDDELSRMYLNSLVESSVFSEPDEVLQRVKEGEPIKEIIIFALGAEKESILFYYTMLDQLERNKGLVKKIIRQEKEHIVKLNEILAKI